jgi:hypothetical protein
VPIRILRKPEPAEPATEPKETEAPSTWLESMKEAVRSDRRLLAALDLGLNTPVPPELARSETPDDVEAFVAEVDRDASARYAEWLESQYRQALLYDYRGRMLRLYRKQPTELQICQDPRVHVDPSDFRKYLAAHRKFPSRSSVTKRIDAFLRGDDLPEGA